MSLKKKRKIIWLTWERQIRNRSMAKHLGVPVFEVLFNHGRFVRYVISIIITLRILCKERPSIVICQNPSIVLTVLLIFLRNIFNYKMVIDAHFGAVDAGNGSKAPQRVLDWCNRTADLIIVTNDHHAHYVRGLGGRVFICPDPLPDLSRYRQTRIDATKNIFLICSFDVDEPYCEILKAFDELANEGFRLSISGKYKSSGIIPDDFPYVKFLGFLPEDEYYQNLFSSQLIIDLTDNDNCLVCGAYEALSAGKPLVLSKKKALMNYFTGGTVFTENKAEGIAEAVRQAYAGKEKLAEDSRLWALKEKNKNKKRIVNLIKILENI